MDIISPFCELIPSRRIFTLMRSNVSTSRLRFQQQTNKQTHLRVADRTVRIIAIMWQDAKRGASSSNPESVALSFHVVIVLVSRTMKSIVWVLLTRNSTT
jgi:hypothetical protein